MDFNKTFQSARDIAMLKVPGMKKVAEDKNAFKPALFIVALASFIVALGYFIFPVSMSGFVYRPDLVWVISQTLMVFVMNVVMLYVVGFLGEELFKAKLDMNGFVRVMGHAMVVNVLAIIPVLSLVSGLWMLVLLFKVYKELGKLETGAIILLLILGIIAIVTVSSLSFSFDRF